MSRLFIGIKIKPAKSLEDTFNVLKKNLSKSNIKWVDSKNFHLTLKFLGDVEEYYIHPLIMLLDKIASENSQFKILSQGLGFFGRTMHPRVIWYGFKPDEHLLNLQSSIEMSLLDLGFDKEDKSYSHHLTLGRVKKMMPYCNLEEILSTLDSKTEKYTISKFSLIESILKEEGPVYRVIKDFSLKE